jgi:hypothetical protein
VPPTTVSEAIALLLRDNNSTDSKYLRVQIFTGFMYIGSALCLWLVRGWKVGDLARAKEEAVAAVDTRHTGDSAAGNVPSADPAFPVRTTSNLNPWTPSTLLRGMVALKRV